MKKVAAIVLAAGRGTRIKAPNGKNKVVFDLGNRPMVSYSVENLQEAGVSEIIAVVGFARESVQAVLRDTVTYAIQEEALGTGHAVKVGFEKVPEEITRVFSVYGDDSAFYPPSLYQKLLKHHDQAKADLTVVTIEKDDPTGLGRIIRDASGNISAIVEEKNASPEQKAIKEINTGLYCFDRQFLKNALQLIKPNPVTNEYYLTDVVEIGCQKGAKVEALRWPYEEIWFGVNTREQLEEANSMMQARQTTHPTALR